MNFSTEYRYFFSDEENWPNRAELRVFESMDQNYFPSPWTSQQWAELQGTPGYLLVEFKYGFALFKLIALENLAHLLKIVILPENRKCGLGKKLLLDSINRLSLEGYGSIYLEVEEGNTVAQKLYASIGFKSLHLVKHFYGSGRHAWTMGLGRCANN